MLIPRLITPPVGTPIDVDDAKLNMGVDHDDLDGMIGLWIEAATEVLDGYDGIMGQCLMDQTWEQTFDENLDCRLYLPLSPVSSIVSIKYLDTDGNTQTVDAAEYKDPPEEDALGAFVELESVPSTKDGRLIVQFVAGYGDATKVPSSLKAAIHLFVSALHEHREKDLAMTDLTTNPSYRALIARIRLRKI